jgi:hypothetical protein
MSLIPEIHLVFKEVSFFFGGKKTQKKKKFRLEKEEEEDDCRPTFTRKKSLYSIN